MIKKSLLLILSVLFSVFANAAILEYGGLRYNILKSDGIAEVVGYGSAPTGALVIPESVYFEGVLCSVKTIASGTFYGCAEITSVEIPNSVETIGHSAFEECSGIETVSIGENVTFIGDCAFCYCSSLKALHIPAKVDSIGVCAFIRCYNIESMTVSDSNNKFDSRGGCNAIIETATNNLIAGCQNTLIPETVTGIGFRAFYEQSKLESLIIPNSVTSVGDESIRDCFGLKTLTIGRGVTEIGYTAILYRSTSLTDIYCYAAEPPACEDTYSSVQVTLHVPEEALETYKSTAPWNEFGNIVAITKYAEDVEIGNLTYNINTDCQTAKVSGYVTEPTGELVIPESVVFEGAVCKVTAIGSDAFNRCSGITSVVIPNSVATIGTQAFVWCTGLSSLSIPNSVTTIEYGAFDGCNGLTSLTIPNGATTIGSYAFAKCSGLTSVVIPESVDSVGIGVFSSCSGLKEMSVAGNNPRYDSRNNCNAIIETSTNTLIAGSKSTVIPNDVEAIGNDAFQGCVNLTTIEIPESVREIRDFAFEYCSGLTSLELPGGLTVIGKKAFNNCGLSSVNIPDGVKIIGKLAFGDCGNLVSVSIPGSVDSVELDAFANCSGLKSVTFSEGLKQLGQGVFYNCSSLKEVVLPNTLESMGEGVFRECDSLTTVTLGASTDSIARWALGGTSLTDLYCYAQTLPETHSEIFVNGASGDYSTLELSGATLHVPEEALEAYKSTAPWSEFGNIVAIAKYAEDVEIGNLTYNINTDSMTAKVSGYVTEPTGELVIPESVMYEGAVCKVTTINDSAFYSCSGITSVTIPRTVNRLLNSAFYGCKGLTAVHINDLEAWCSTDISNQYAHPLNYAKHLFLNGEEIVDLVIPDGVSIIRGGVFLNCYGLKNVTIPESVKIIENNAFEGCVGLTSIKLPNSITTIENSTFVGCTSLTSVVIPGSVKTIGSSAFRSCSGLTSLTIPNSVTSIGSSAFSWCASLTSLTIPNSVTVIGSYAFYDCSGLKTIEIPNSVTTIGSSAFAYCDGLTSVVIPESVDSVGIGVFSSCSGLKEMSVAGNNPRYDSRNDCNAIIETSTNTLITGCMSTIIPNSVTAIGSYAFDYCSGLTSVVIPGSVKTIGLDAFAHCSGLESVTFSEGLEQLGQGVFYSCPSLKEVVLPNTLKSIGSGAFRECDSLTTVTLGASTDSIARWALGGTILTNLYCYAQALPETHSEIFVNGASGDYSTLELSGATLHVPEEALETYKSTAPWSEFGNIVAITKYAEDVEIGNLTYNINTDSLTAEVTGYVTEPTGELVIPESVVFEGAVCKVTAIGSSAFSWCTSLTSLTIPNSVTLIGSSAFSWCTRLTSLTIPNSVTSIGSSAFYSCSGLTSVVIPNSVTSIGSYAFSRCSGLTSLTIPNSVTSIGSSAFSICSGLNTISVDSSNPMYNSQNNCNAIIETSTNTLITGCMSTIIPNSVTTIGSSAFADCSGLKTIEIPNSVTTIGSSAFADCDGLTSVVIPESVDFMGPEVFIWCSGLETISVDSNNPKYDSRNDCNAIIETSTNTLIVGSKSTVIPDGVTTIGSSAFADCSGLTSVVIPGSVKTIESNAFKSCSGLEEATFSEGLENLAQGAFYGCRSLEEVVLPNTLESIGSYAFDDCDGLTSVVIPGSVKTIELDAFAYCSGLESVTFSEGLKQLEQGAFYGCSSLKEVVLPNTLESMGEGVFRDCTSLTTVTLGESIDSIARWALGGTSLTDLYCYAQALPETHSEIFLHNTGYDSDLSGATLHVPEEALEAYKSTAPWSEFGNIVAMRSPVTVTIGSTGATTFCSEYDLDFSDVEGIKAYVATGYNSATGAITMMRVTEVKAGTGLYIRGEAGVYDVPKAEDVTFNSLNMLVGVTAAVSVAPTNGEYTNYVYTKPSGKPAAFYKLTSARNVPAGKSYLQIPTLWLPVASEARIMLDFDDWDATGIDDVEDTSVPGEQIIYDLQGRRVTNPTKGIYIVNGKKVLYR